MKIAKTAFSLKILTLTIAFMCHTLELSRVCKLATSIFFKILFLKNVRARV